MPVFMDLRAVRAEAKDLLGAARVSPPRFTLLFLAIDLGLSLVGAAASRLPGGSVDILSFSFSFVGVFVALLSTVLLAGYANYCLCVQRGREMPYDSLFDAFPFAGKVILLGVLEGALVCLGLVLFVVPGVILAFSYAFALYHLCEEPEIGVVEALRRSRGELRGYKWQLFLLLAGFWPLLLLAALAPGLCEYFLGGLFPETLSGELLHALVSGAISAAAQAYLMPYVELSQVVFYRRATEAHEENRLD